MKKGITNSGVKLNKVIDLITKDLRRLELKFDITGAQRSNIFQHQEKLKFKSRSKFQKKTRRDLLEITKSLKHYLSY